MIRFKKGEVVRSRRSGRLWRIAEDNEMWNSLAMVVPTHNSELHHPLPINVVNLDPYPTPTTDRAVKATS